MIKIDDKEMFFSSTFPVADEKTVFIEIPLGGENTTFGLTFHANNPAEQSRGSWETIEGRVMFDFYNWSNPLGHATKAPVEIGTFENKRISMQVVNHHVGGINLVHIFLFK